MQKILLVGTSADMQKYPTANYATVETESIRWIIQKDQFSDDQKRLIMNSKLALDATLIITFDHWWEDNDCNSVLQIARFVNIPVIHHSRAKQHDITTND